MTDAEKAELKTAEELTIASTAAHMKGDFKSAAVSAVKARRLREKILGSKHFLTVTSTNDAKLMALLNRATPEKQKEIGEAEKQAGSAEAAAARGDFLAARSLALSAIDIREHGIVKNDPNLISLLRVFGNAQLKLHSLADAQQSLLRALNLAETLYGKDHPLTARVLDRLGWLKICQGEYGEAAKHLRRAVWIFMQAQGESAETAESLDNLGTALAFSGDDGEALQSKLRALFIREALLGPESRDTGISLANLAWFYERIGNRREVVELHRRALAIFEKTQGMEHPDTLTERGNLAQAYYAAREYREAEKIYEQQVARDDAGSGSWLAGGAERLTMLAAVYLQLGKQAEAEKALQRSIDKCNKIYAKGEQSAAMRELLRIVDVYDRNRMITDAATTRESIMKWYQARGTDAADEAIRVSARLGSLYLDLGRLEQAAEILTKTVGQANQKYGEGDLESLEPLLALSVAFEKLGRLDEAVKTCEKALRVTETKLRKGNPLAVFALHLLGRIQLQKKKYEIAEFALEDCLDQIKLNKIKDLILEARVLRELASCQASQEKWDGAQSLFRQSIAAVRAAATDDNPKHKAELAASIHRFLDAANHGLPLDSRARDALRTELHEILEKLRVAKALDADNQEWLQELSSVQKNR